MKENRIIEIQKQEILNSIEAKICELHKKMDEILNYQHILERKNEILRIQQTKKERDIL